MKVKAIKERLINRGLTEWEANTLIDLAKRSQKTVVFAAAVKRTGASNMSATISICYKTKESFRSLDFYLNKVCGYKWSKNHEGVIVNGCGFNRIYALLDCLADALQLAGQEKSNFTRYFTL